MPAPKFGAGRPVACKEDDAVVLRSPHAHARFRINGCTKTRKPRPRGRSFQRYRNRSSSLVDQSSCSGCWCRLDRSSPDIIVIAVVWLIDDLALRLACRQHRSHRRRRAYARNTHRNLVGGVYRPDCTL